MGFYLPHVFCPLRHLFHFHLLSQLERPMHYRNILPSSYLLCQIYLLHLRVHYVQMHTLYRLHAWRLLDYFHHNKNKWFQHRWYWKEYNLLPK